MSGDDLYEKLIQSALRFVSFRPRSQKEIRDFLAKKLARRHTTAPLILQKVLDRLDELGYIDDERFAFWWVEQRDHFRPKGRRLLEIELAKKGMSGEIIDQVLNRTRKGEGKTEKERAIQAVGKKLALWQRLPVLERKKKLYDFLMRRGFASETAFAVIDELVGKE